MRHSLACTILSMSLAITGNPPRSALAQNDPNPNTPPQTPSPTLSETLESLANSIRSSLASEPDRAVDRLNSEWLPSFLSQKQYELVLEFSAAGILALPADTWRVEQLLRHRIRAYLQTNRPKEALAAAKELYNVCGIGFLPTALELLTECLRAAYPDKPAIVSQFKLQQLAGAQTDPHQRNSALKDLGPSVVANISTNPKTWLDALQRRSAKSDYRSLYGNANLLLLANRNTEAKNLFEKILASAPPSETRYASEGLAKAIKAEDGFIGRANAWILSVRTTNHREK